MTPLLFRLVNPRSPSRLDNALTLPPERPPASRHSFQSANRALALVFSSLGSTTHRSSSHCPKSSSDERYSSVAATTLGGGARPSRCHAKQPSTAHRRIAGPSAFSLSG